MLWLLQHACWILLVSPSFGTHSNPANWVAADLRRADFDHAKGCRISAHASSRYKRNKFTSEFSPRPPVMNTWQQKYQRISWLFRKAWSLPMNGCFPSKFLMSMEWHGRSLIGTLNCMTEDHVTSNKLCPWFGPALLSLQNDNNHVPNFGTHPNDMNQQHASTHLQL